MNPEPIPQPVLMNTVALRAVSMGLRAGKLLASCASSPSSPCSAGAAGSGTVAGAAAAGAAAPTGAGALGRVRSRYHAAALLRRAVSTMAPQPKRLAGPAAG